MQRKAALYLLGPDALFLLEDGYSKYRLLAVAHTVLNALEKKLGVAGTCPCG